MEESRQVDGSLTMIKTNSSCVVSFVGEGGGRKFPLHVAGLV